jgi:outer membrane immunogenic protein
MRFTTLLTATVAAVGIATSASAADMPTRYNKAPAYMPPVGYNWTGFYAGLNAGYGWTRNGFAGDNHGFVGGGQIGYNWQAIGSPFVFGVEADFQGADLSNSAALGGGVTLNGRSNAFGTVRGRIGYAWDRAMLYGTGGYAYVRNEVSATGPGGSISNSQFRSGYTLGGGLEYALWDRWSVKGEYLYVHTDNASVTLAGVNFTGNNNINVVRVGVNYHF